MEKISVEVCLISARGLPRSSLWKLQWFAVGWIYPNDKYCTKIDWSSNGNPVWKTKFASMVDTPWSKIQEIVLHIEVYSREPIFLREKFQGRTTIELKEFFTKAENVPFEQEEHELKGSFKLRRKNSTKARGVVDVSVRISMERETSVSYAGHGGFRFNYNDITLEAETELMEASQQRLPALRRRDGRRNPSMSYRYSEHPNENPSLDEREQPAETRSNSAVQRTPSPPLPPPPLSIGRIPTLFPSGGSRSTMYINGATSQGRDGPDMMAGLGTRALAAGAMIFGDDFLSGFSSPATRC